MKDINIKIFLMPIRINMLSLADTVPGQGVSSAYLEQKNLVADLPDFDFAINSRKKDFDIYHIHSVNLRYRLRMNKKHINIVSVHFIPSENEGSIKLPGFISRLFDKYVEGMYKKADELVVVNPSFIPSLEKLNIKRDKITYIPNYVSGDNFYPLGKEEVEALKETYNIPKDKFIVLACGQIQTRKAFQNFIEIAKNRPDMFYIWVGGFSFGRIMHGYKSNKRTIENLPPNVIVTGIVDRNKMNEYYNMADVFFMPSYMELFPMSILEACNVHKPLLLRRLLLYTPILFDKFAFGSTNEEFIAQLDKLATDKTYYNTQVENSIFISHFYNKNAVRDAWRSYYTRIYKKYNKNK